MTGTNVTVEMFIREKDGTIRPFTDEDYPADHPSRIPVPPGLTPVQVRERNMESVRRMNERTRELQEQRTERTLPSAEQ